MHSQGVLTTGGLVAFGSNLCHACPKFVRDRWVVSPWSWDPAFVRRATVPDRPAVVERVREDGADGAFSDPVLAGQRAVADVATDVALEERRCSSDSASERMAALMPRSSSTDGRRSRLKRRSSSAMLSADPRAAVMDPRCGAGASLASESRTRMCWTNDCSGPSWSSRAILCCSSSRAASASRAMLARLCSRSYRSVTSRSSTCTSSVPSGSRVAMGTSSNQRGGCPSRIGAVSAPLDGLDPSLLAIRAPSVPDSEWPRSSSTL